MWDRQRRGARRRELHSRKVRRQPDGYLCNRQPTMVGDVVRATAPETVPASHVVETNTIRLLGNTPESSAHGDQVASSEGTSRLALGGLRSGFDWNLRAGLKKDVEAPRPKGFLAHEAEMVYRGHVGCISSRLLGRRSESRPSQRGRASRLRIEQGRPHSVCRPRLSLLSVTSESQRIRVS